MKQSKWNKPWNTRRAIGSILVAHGRWRHLLNLLKAFVHFLLTEIIQCLCIRCTFNCRDIYSVERHTREQEVLEDDSCIGRFCLAWCNLHVDHLTIPSWATPATATASDYSHSKCHSNGVESYGVIKAFIYILRNHYMLVTDLCTHN